MACQPVFGAGTVPYMVLSHYKWPALLWVSSTSCHPDNSNLAMDTLPRPWKAWNIEEGLWRGQEEQFFFFLINIGIADLNNPWLSPEDMGYFLLTIVGVEK